MLSVQIAKYLDDLNIGTFDETGVTGNIFVETLPDAPDSSIAILSTGGLKDDGINHTYPTVQVLVRGNRNVKTTFNKAQDIYRALNNFCGARFSVDGDWIVNCVGVQSAPINIGEDLKRRTEFSLNFQLITKFDE